MFGKWGLQSPLCHSGLDVPAILGCTVCIYRLDVVTIPAILGCTVCIYRLDVVTIPAIPNKVVQYSDFLFHRFDLVGNATCIDSYTITVWQRKF